jgi:phosphoribosyl 1,2-cyclic phosphate phosphodiesterase
MTLTITILGCGSSGGVPRVGSGWGACDPNNPKNRRRRCSILVERAGESGTTTVLVDTSPDLREQLLDAGVRRLDAVLFTHEHADHTHGIDDLRPLVIHMRRRIPVYANHTTGELLRMRFGYCFHAPAGSDYPPILTEHRIEAGVAVEIEGPGGVVSALPFPLEHGKGEALGFRFGDFAYVNDVSAVPDDAMPVLSGLRVIIVDALRHTPHPTHFSVSEALAFIERIRPQHAVLTNMHTDVDYADLAARLPANVEPAYDGMRLTVPLASK